MAIKEEDLALCLMLNACLKNGKKLGVVQLGHRWFGLVSSMPEGSTDCTTSTRWSTKGLEWHNSDLCFILFATTGLVLSVLSPKLPLYDLVAWTEEISPSLISTSAPPYSPFATSFPIKKACRFSPCFGTFRQPLS